MAREQERDELHRTIWTMENHSRESLDEWDFKIIYPLNSIISCLFALLLSWHVDIPAFAAPLPEQPQNTNQRILAKKRSIIRIFAYHEEDLACGTGCIIDKEGHVLTNQHVIKGASEIYAYILTPNSTSASCHKLILIYENLDKDLALLRIQHPPKGIPEPFELSSKKPAVLEEVIALGFPSAIDIKIPLRQSYSNQERLSVEFLENLDPNLTKGTISKVGSRITHDAKISKGSSGGALVSVETGKIVGINTAGTSGSTSFYFAIPISEVLAILNKLTNDSNTILNLENTIKDNPRDTASMIHLARCLLKDSHDASTYSPRRAMELLNAAVSEGDDHAMYELAKVLSEGIHVKQNISKSIELLSKSKYKISKNLLFILYFYGRGSYKGDGKKAFALAQSMYNTSRDEYGAISQLADCYSQGVGVKQDITKAIALLKEDDNFEPDILARTLLRSPKKQDQVEGLNMLINVAKPNNKKISNEELGFYCNELAVIFFNGRIVKKDLSRHLYYLQLGAEVKDTACMANLGIACIQGRGLTPNPTLGISLIEESIDRGGSITSRTYIASYYKSIGRTKEAYKIYLQCAEAGCGLAKTQIAISYLYGKNGFPLNQKKGLAILREVANDRSDPNAASAAQDLMQLFVKKSTPAK